MDVICADENIEKDFRTEFTADSINDITNRLEQLSRDKDALIYYVNRLHKSLIEREYEPYDDLHSRIRNLERNGCLNEKKETNDDFRESFLSFYNKLLKDIEILKNVDFIMPSVDVDVSEYDKLFLENYVLAMTLKSVDIDEVFKGYEDLIILTNAVVTLTQGVKKYDEALEGFDRVGYDKYFKARKENV